MGHGIIISGFQGIGKTTYAKSHPNTVDLESSNFDKTNEKWYLDYCRTALDLMEKGHTVFVSSHKIVRDYLLRQTPYYIMVCPTMEMKDVWIQDLADRYKMDPTPKNYRAWKAAEFDYDNYIKEISEDKYLQVYWIKSTNERYLSDDMMASIWKAVSAAYK